MYAFDKRKIKLKEELKRIESIAKSDADKDIASYLLINESKMLSGYGLNDIAIKYAETANRLVDLDDYSKGIFNIIQEFTKIEKLRKINKFFKIFLSGRLSYYFGIDPPVGIDEMSKLFINQMQSDPANTTIKKNIDYIELEFPNIYEMLGDSFPGMVRDFPAAYYYASDCPGSSCKQRYQIEKSAASAEYYCDKCSTSYKWDYTNNKFKISFSGGGGSSSDCFVAGAVYQSDIHPQVLFLRNFRDTILRKYFFGRLFIKFYYLFGPYGALVIKKNTFLIKYVKDYLLEPLIRIIKKIV